MLTQKMLTQEMQPQKKYEYNLTTDFETGNVFPIKRNSLTLLNKMLMVSLVSSLIGNVILMGTTVHFSSNPVGTNSSVVNCSVVNSSVVNSSAVNSSAVNSSAAVNSLHELPYNNTCLLDTTFGYVKEHIYAHICYNPWLHTSFVDLRFEKDGKITLGILKTRNFTDINGDWTIA